MYHCIDIENLRNNFIKYYFLGILSLIQEPKFVVHLFILYEVLSIINILSNKLQEKAATLGKAIQLVQSVVQSLTEYRTDVKFSVIWNEISDFSQKNKVSVAKPFSKLIYTNLYCIS